MSNLNMEISLSVLVLTLYHTVAYRTVSPQNRNNTCLSEDYVFRQFIHSVPKTCMKECDVRPLCKAVNYHRTYKLCELLNRDSGNMSNHSQPCQLLKKADMVVPVPENCSNCTVGQTCDIDKHINNVTCVYKECRPLSLHHGYVLGNMYEVGSRIVYGCNEGYIRSTATEVSVCEDDGTWSGNPHCIPDQGQDDVTSYLCSSIEIHDEQHIEYSKWMSYFGNYFIVICNNLPCYIASDCEQKVDALYLGCFLDCQYRLLEHRITDYNPVTKINCIWQCFKAGYQFAYTEQELCYCGNEVKHYTQVGDYECSTPCTGLHHSSETQLCGGPNRASLYAINNPDLTARINNETVCNADGSSKDDSVEIGG